MPQDNAPAISDEQSEAVETDLDTTVSDGHDVQDSSLTTEYEGSEDDPRDAFINAQSADDEEANDDDDADLDDAIEGENADEDDEDDEDDDDLDVEDIIKEDDEDNAPVDANFKVSDGVSSKVFKSLPEEAKTYITQTQREYKRLKAEYEQEAPVASYTRALLGDAQRAGFTPAAFNDLATLSFRANAGDEEAVQILGDIYYQAGYRPATVDVDTSSLEAFVKDELAVDLDPSQVNQLTKLINQMKGSAAKAPSLPNAERNKHDRNTMIEQAFMQAKDTALEKINAINTRLADKVDAQVLTDARNAVQVELARSPLWNTTEDIAKLPVEYAKLLKQEIVARRKVAQQQKVGRKLRNTDGISARATGNKKSNVDTSNLDPREAFIQNIKV